MASLDLPLEVQEERLVEPEDAKGGSFGDGSDKIIGACIEVHRHLGPGLLESVYSHALCRELSLLGLPFERGRKVPIPYKGVLLDAGHELDLVVDSRIMIELKAVAMLLPVHQAQVLTYLKLTGLDAALLVNFNVAYLKQGLRRFARRTSA
ncbi:MAG: GxxExxY protein [Bryobacteraceae bacterium]